MGGRRVRHNADERDLLAVPPARTHAAAVALAGDVLATSLGTHAAYVTAVAVVDDAVRRA